MRLRDVMTAVGALVAMSIAVGPDAAQAVNACKAKVDKKDGAILVSGRDATGTLTWGGAAGQETNAFDNAASCVDAGSGKAKNCTLGAIGSPERITPPELCTIYLADGGANDCAAFIQGCTPGLRSAPSGSVPTILYASCTGTLSAAAGGASSACTATCPAGSIIIGGTCANQTATPQFVQGDIADPPSNTQWSCTVKNQNSSATAIQALGTAICLQTAP